MPRPPIDDLRAIAELALQAGEFALTPLKAVRDKNEPGRREKMSTQSALALIIIRVFRKQRKLLLNSVQYLKATPITPELLFDDEWSEDDEAELIAELLKAVKNGIVIAKGVDLIDSTIVNKEAAAWARRYAGKLIDDINSTTLSVLREAVAMFIETPGFTIGDLMNMLPFDEERALTISVTETTRAYAQGNALAGKQLAKEFPDTSIIETWFTNNDDIVCDLCGPLDGTEIEFGTTFYEPDEYNDGHPPRHVKCRCWTEVSTKVT